MHRNIRNYQKEKNGVIRSYPQDFANLPNEEFFLQSEYNPILTATCGFSSDIVVVLKIYPYESHKPIRFNTRPCINGPTYASYSFNNNGGIAFTKKNLQDILNVMEETDVLYVMSPNHYDKERFVSDCIKLFK
jgi:hypothetical protein